MTQAIQQQQEVQQSLDISQKANMLTPAYALNKRINPFQEAKIVLVKINANPNDGEVYPQSGKLALTKNGLMKLASAAGLKVKTKVVESSRDYVCMEAEISYLNASGVKQEAVGTYEIDMTVIEEEIMNRPKSTEEAKRREILQFRRYKLQRCESGAINRGIRSVLSIKNTYTPQELAKPFAVPFVQFSPDFTDPDVKRAAIQNMSGAVGTLYGETPEFREGCPAPQVEKIELEAPQEPVENNIKNAFQGSAENAQTESVQSEPQPVQSQVEQKPDKNICQNCGGPTEYKDGVNKTSGKQWAAYFCTAKCGADPQWTSIKQQTAPANSAGPGF